jgi:(p)ppGpp synthase/HD superfamily hydrolase
MEIQDVLFFHMYLYYCMTFVQDVGKVKETAVELKAEAAENRKAMIDLSYSVAENKTNISKLDVRTTAMQEEIVALKSKINEVNELRQLIKVCDLHPCL